MLRLMVWPVACILAGAGQAAPLPPDRPAEFGAGRTPVPEPAAPSVSTTPAAPPVATTPQAADAACLSALRDAGGVAEAAAQPGSGNPACLIETPVRLSSVSDPASPGRTILFPERPLLACRQAASLLPWALRVAAPVLEAAHGARLKAIRTGPGYECRGRNRQPDAKISAHGSGLALDIAAFDFADGKTLSIAEDGARPRPDPALAAIRTAACGWFTTVLGPGSDPYHATHLHLDTQRHGSSDRYRICQ